MERAPQRVAAEVPTKAVAVARCLVQPLAQADVDEALAWYDEQTAGLAQQLLAELDAVFARISENPAQFAFVKEPIRRALLRRFPYSVYYLVDGEVAAVIAVVHQRRHPDTWKRSDRTSG